MHICVKSEKRNFVKVFLRSHVHKNRMDGQTENRMPKIGITTENGSRKCSLVIQSSYCLMFLMIVSITSSQPYAFTEWMFSTISEVRARRRLIIPARFTLCTVLHDQLLYTVCAKCFKSRAERQQDEFMYGCNIPIYITLKD